ncbi:MAG: DNA repair protein RecN [Candidatus Baltobacteraceae bacterium]
MLRRLEIENYGLIDRADIIFSEAATIFTGETGSGKTMIIGALAFALGARANADVVRRGAARAVVTLAFDPEPALAASFAQMGFDVDAGEEATIVREMTDAGKSSVRLNGRASTASSVRAVSQNILEIVGQHEAQHLLVPGYHLELLDRFAGVAAVGALATVAEAHGTLASRLREHGALQGDEREAQRGYDDARYALDEIEDARPEPDEDIRLTERSRFLNNIERIATALRAAHEALAGDEASATEAFGTATAALRGIAEIGTDLSDMAAVAGLLQSEATELAVRISRELDATQSDPAELEAINARLNVLDRLKGKYGGSLASVLARAERARVTVSEFERRDELVAESLAAVVRARTQLERDARVLTEIREQAARRLIGCVADEFRELALSSARFDVAFPPLNPVGPAGAESVEFSFAANVGEPVRPLARVASGGELSRVLLALVVVLAGAREQTALIFDEIDAGIGGTTATAVGARVGRLARAGQVVCVTHLAQLATWADRHYVLEKRESRGSTTISVREISGGERRSAELARMLSGETHEVALAHARALLRDAARVEP